METWPPKKLGEYEQLYLDENTLIFRNSPKFPYQNGEWIDEILAFDAESGVISASGNFSESGRIVGEITFGSGGVIDAATPKDMAMQIEAYVEGFTR